MAETAPDNSLIIIEEKDLPKNIDDVSVNRKAYELLREYNAKNPKNRVRAKDFRDNPELRADVLLYVAKNVRFNTTLDVSVNLAVIMEEVEDLMERIDDAVSEGDEEEIDALAQEPFSVIDSEKEHAASN